MLPSGFCGAHLVHFGEQRGQLPHAVQLHLGQRIIGRLGGAVHLARVDLRVEKKRRQQPSASVEDFRTLVLGASECVLLGSC